jgi:predicted secreted hydrolase
MYYQLRNHQGQASPYSGGTWVQTDGTSQHLTSEDVHLKVTDYWVSPIDGARYPAGWEIEVKQHKMLVRPKLANQELSGMGRYWEGAVEVTGLKGQGYVEMVGYKKD